MLCMRGRKKNGFTERDDKRENVYKREKLG
jgi:hypothetical protein